MELSKKSELTLGSASYVISTELSGEAAPQIETRVLAADGTIVHRAAQDISALKPIFQNSQKVFSRMEAQHQKVVSELKAGALNGGHEGNGAATGGAVDESQRETDALQHAIAQLGTANFEKATAALRAVLETYPNCSEARELLEIAYKASSGARLSIDVDAALRRGTEAFSAGKQREAIESWKQCLIEEPGNRRLQVLVLLATTWSPERRQSYASEILAPNSPLLTGGRAEEAQALLLVAQTIDGSVDQPTAPVGTLTAAAPDAPLSDLVTEPVLEPAPKPAPPPPAAKPAPPPPAARPAPPPPAARPAPPPPAAKPAPPPPAAKPAPPPLAAKPAPPPPAEPAPPPVAPKQETPAPVAPLKPEPKSSEPPVISTPSRIEDEPRPQASPAPQRTAPPRPRDDDASDASQSMPRGPRRPPTPARRSEVPWGIIGGAIGVLLLIGGVAFWLLSGESSVPTDRLESAASLVGAGQYAQAVNAYDQLLTEYGDIAAVYLGRGRAKVASGNTDGGLTDLKRAYELNPEVSEIAEEIGDVYYSVGGTEAVDYYEKAFAAGGGSAEARYRLASSLVERERGDDALEHLQAAIRSEPQHGEAQFLYGELMNERGRFSEAETALRASESSMGTESDFLAQLAIALLGQNKLDQAEETARAFLRSYPSDARAHSLLGEVYLSRKQYEPARAQLIQALRTDRNEPRAQIALGRTWLAIGKARGDMQELGKARQVLRNAQGVHEGQRLLALGQISLAEGDLPTAERLLRQSLEHGAPSLPVHLSLAEVRARGEDLVGAAEEMQRASGYAPEDPAISLSLAMTYSQLSENARAAEQFLKTIQGVGLITPPGEDAGPVVLPEPYIPIPERFNVNRAIKDAYEKVLAEREDDPTATELRTLAESATFVVGAAG